MLIDAWSGLFLILVRVGCGILFSMSSIVTSGMVRTTKSMMDTVTRLGAAAAASDAAADTEVCVPCPTDAALSAVPNAGTTAMF